MLKWLTTAVRILKKTMWQHQQGQSLLKTAESLDCVWKAPSSSSAVVWVCVITASKSEACPHYVEKWNCAKMLLEASRQQNAQHNGSRWHKTAICCCFPRFGKTALSKLIRTPCEGNGLLCLWEFHKKRPELYSSPVSVFYSSRQKECFCCCLSEHQPVFLHWFVTFLITYAH